jgi:hypothetical protein
VNQQQLAEAIQSAIEAMRASKPRALRRAVAFQLDDEEDVELDEATIAAELTKPDLNYGPRKAVHMALAIWDAAREAEWSANTASRSSERREQIYEVLKLSADTRKLLGETFPIALGRDVILAEPAPWDPWYTVQRQAAHNFYWNAYRGVLESKTPAWDPEALANLDAATTDIIGRLADPTRPEHYQTKGLVVGYVQSGKTANFTGIIAKAIDAGYRLVIVLTGTIELLRGQTQRRLDMELVGEENILGGRDRNDPEAIRDLDYFGTDDADLAAGKFLRHGIEINRNRDVPGITRLTTMEKGYRRLRLGLDALDFARTGELHDPAKPVYDPDNLFGVDARIAVMLKNTTALKAIIRDLQDIQANMAEIPVLIIDDEADQASINTRDTYNPNSSGYRERTAINKLIGELLKKLPRAQYLAYTATPYANVFATPAEATDVSPKDFIINLEPSPAYLGAKAFHDLEKLPDGVERTPSNSNEKAYVRDLRADNDNNERVELRGAIDAFVLSGAIKKWRKSQGLAGDFKHHTMLVHSSSRQADHVLLAQMVRDVWSTAGYSLPDGLSRLESAFENDFRMVTDSRAWSGYNPLPVNFEDLVPHIGATVDHIMATDDPVVVVNGSKDSEYRAMDFQLGPYWRVMVGGTKLSRGFTVEGLTVSYFRRRATAASTLMQMGRWFGYRPGYQDLVRLYIGREVVSGTGVYDMYDAFSSIVKDEEDFRDQIRQYANMKEDGRPLITPKDLPPFVFWSLNWLPPVAANQRYNARLTAAGAAGKLSDLRRFPREAGPAHQERLARVAMWISSAVPVKLPRDNGRPYDARVAIVSASEVLDALKSFKWDGDVAPSLGFIDNAVNKLNLLDDFAVIFPNVGEPATVNGIQLNLVRRRYREERKEFYTRDSHLDPALVHLGQKPNADGSSPATLLYDELTIWDPSGRRAALLVEFANLEPGNVIPSSGEKVAPLFSFVMPGKTAAAGRPALQVFDPARPNAIVVAAN